MSFHAAGSDLAAIAAAGAGELVAVSDDTWRVLALAIRLGQETGGLFDMAVAPELVRRGLLPAPGSGGSPADAPSASSALSLEGSGRVRVHRPVWIDLGGIAKGAAVDAAIDALKRSGAVSGRVHAGGDIALFGSPRAMRVRGPEPRRLLVDAGMLDDAAMATSSWPAHAASALVSPRGAPAAWGDRSVTVVAPTCAIADALTKVVGLVGAGAGRYLRPHGAIAFAVDNEGQVEHVA